MNFRNPHIYLLSVATFLVSAGSYYFGDQLGSGKLFNQKSEVQRLSQRETDGQQLPKKFDAYGELINYGKYDLGKVTNIHTADLDGDGDLDVIVSTDSHVIAIENKMNQKSPNK